ncbi:MAG: phosphopantothenoylcysteine decarboxylase [Planctomycetota bacterium]|nr:phosphopantothenoylcysteine decarboxylase [Planctomycetota bacterium]
MPVPSPSHAPMSQTSRPTNQPAPTSPSNRPGGSASGQPAHLGRRLLITAGPTHEPIDSVRFIGNRSSGRMGAAVADAAASAGWETTLLLGPAPALPTHPGVRLIRFRTCADLQALLRQHAPDCDVLIMAAAVADYRPKPNPLMSGGKFRRTSQVFTLELEPTPDLIAEVSTNRRDGQFLVGFALEPAAELLDAARGKLERKRLDMVVGNPLETMDSSDVSATLVGPGGWTTSSGHMTKAEFAPWLLDVIDARRTVRA